MIEVLLKVDILTKVLQQSHYISDNFEILVLPLTRFCALWLNNLYNYFSERTNIVETCGKRRTNDECQSSENTEVIAHSYMEY